MIDKRKISGFTMLEMIVVVVILSIIATISFLGFSRTISRQKVVGEHRSLIGAMRYIADEARVRKIQLRVTVDFLKDSLVAWQDVNNNSAIDTGELVIHVFKTQSGVDFWSGRFGTTIKKTNHSFRIYDDGTPEYEVQLVIKSVVTAEFLGITLKQTSGWIDQLVVPNSLK